MLGVQYPVNLCSNLTVGKKVRGSQTSAENDPLVAVIKVIVVSYKCSQFLISLCITSVGSMIIFLIRRWGPKFSSKCSRLCWILSCLRNFWGTFEGPIYLEGRVITALIWTVGQPHPKTKHLRDILVSMSKLTHPRFSHSEYFQPLSIGLLRTTLFQQEEKSS